jgi:hypothetical protein
VIAANLIILAFMLEPAESILETPWDYVTPYEFIEPRTLEQIEMEIERDRIRKQFRILEAKPDAKR